MRRLKKEKYLQKNQKKRSEDGRELAAGRFHLPAVAVCWMKESYESTDIERWAAGCTGPADAGRVVVGYLKVEICSVKKKMDGERLLPAAAECLA